MLNDTIFLLFDPNRVESVCLQIPSKGKSEAIILSGKTTTRRGRRDKEKVGSRCWVPEAVLGGKASGETGWERKENWSEGERGEGSDWGLRVVRYERARESEREEERERLSIKQPQVPGPYVLLLCLPAEAVSSHTLTGVKAPPLPCLLMALCFLP